MAAPASSINAVIAALAGNTIVTIIKFVAFFLSGSGAMLSEAIHSAADTGPGEGRSRNRGHPAVGILSDAHPACPLAPHGSVSGQEGLS